MSATWNPSDKHANIALSLGDLRASTDDASGAGWWGVRGTEGKSSGKWYFEVVCVLPWDHILIGVATTGAALTYPGNDALGWGYKASTGNRYWNNVNSAYGDAWTDGDVIGVAVNLDTGYIWFAKNNVWQNGGDPVAGTNPAKINVSGTVYPMAGPYGSNGDSIHCDGRFALQDMSYSPPSGFSVWDPFTVEVEAGTGLGATVEVETLSDTIEAGAGVQAQVEVETTYGEEVTAGAGVEAQAAASGIFGKEVEAGVGVQAESTVFNWAEWLAIYGNQYTARYYLTLTGAPDDLSDVVIPISSFQYRLRDDTPSYLQVVIPGFDYATDIANRANGELIVEMSYLVGGVEQHREQLARVDLEDVQTHEGPRKKSIVLVGHRTETWGAQIVTLRGITYQSDKNGLIRIRCAEPDLFVRPGNTVKAGDETFTAGQVMTAVAAHTQWMEVVEAA